MSWTHSSKVLALGVLLAVALGTAGTAAAVSFNDSEVPDSVQVGETQEFTVTTEDPFADQPGQWTVTAESELENVTITIRAETVDGETFQQAGESPELNISDQQGVNVVEVEVVGEVPAVGEHNYENKEQENFMALQVADADGATLQEWSVHRYTEDSREARQAIDDAQQAVDGDDENLDNAITFYNNGEFDKAISEAEKAESQNESDGGMPIFLIGGAAVALVLVVGGGAYVYTSRQQDTSKLQ